MSTKARSAPTSARDVACEALSMTTRGAGRALPLAAPRRKNRLDARHSERCAIVVCEWGHRRRVARRRALIRWPLSGSCGQ